VSALRDLASYLRELIADPVNCVLAAVFLAGLVLVACERQEPAATPHRAVVEWMPVDEARVRELCQQRYADGCVKKYDGVCTIVTAPMPLEQFTGFNHDMTDSRWRALAHELMHCFGYEHA
jgi:hypothetical protein